MIAFETLFLGLLIGSQQVRLTVAPEVRAVELRLDGEAVATLAGPPWQARCDFGPAPHPHELVAIARDGAGIELGRAHQRVNLPRPKAEAHWFLERDAATRQVTAARLTWENLEAPTPRRVNVTLDGVALRVPDPGRVGIPAHDPGTIHLLTAELVFSDHVTTRADVVFGGELGEQAETRLTAVPVRVDDGAALPPAASMQGWFTAGGRPLRVVAVETAPADVVIVLDLEAGASLRTSRRRMKTDASGQLLALNPARAGEDRMVAIFPTFDTIDRGTDARRLFPVSDPYELHLGNLEVLLGRLRFPGADPKSQLLGNAVAIAGLRAAADNRTRAVVLILGGRGCATGSVTPEAARAFLADLHVPLLVWSLAGAVEDTCWGPAAAAAWPKGLYATFPHLRGDLDRQRIVWLEGAHLPQRIGLTEAARGVRLAR